MKLSTTAVALSATVGAGLVAAVPNAHSTIERRAPAGWTDRGCVKDSQAHLLDTLAYWGPLNSPEHCTKLCGENAYKFAGLEVGQQCFCANEMRSGNGDEGLPATQCTTPCPGDAKQMCGGANFMQLYERAGAGGAAAAPAASSAAASSAVPAAASAPAASGASAAAPAASGGSATSTGPGTVVSGVLAAPASSAQKYVWAHHMVGNTELYNAANWTADVTGAKAAGLDGFALNAGANSYTEQNVQWAYDAAQAAGDFKCFFSFDMTSFPCDTAAGATAIANLAKKYAAHPAQAKYNGKMLVSTFAGETCTFGQGDVTKGWAFVRQQIGSEIYFMPSTFMTTASLQGANWFDGQMHWDAAWPQTAEAPSQKADQDWITALAGKGYMASVSPFFFTYFGKDTWNKNFIYRSDDWLLATRFEQLIGMRDKIDMLELLSWNDFGESHYVAPSPPANFQPKSDLWVKGLPHNGLLTLVKLYSDAFRSGNYAAGQDGLWLWTRPHSKDATPSAPTLSKPTRAEMTEDNLYAVVNLASPATVKIYSGSSTQSWDLQAGVSKLKIPSAAGAVGGEITRDGKVVKSFDSQAADGWAYTDKPVDYNFNYYVGEGVAAGAAGSAPASGSGSGASKTMGTAAASIVAAVALSVALAL